jgi:FtsH-binding integral membrane protein
MDRTSQNHRTADGRRRRRQFTIGGAVAGAIVLLVFPLQTILGLILAGSVWIITMALGVWIERKVAASDRGQVLAAMPFVSAGAVALGVALSFVVPMTMAAVTLVLAVVAAGCMAFLSSYERKTRIERRRERSTADEFAHPERRAA